MLNSREEVKFVDSEDDNSEQEDELEESDHNTEPEQSTENKADFVQPLANTLWYTTRDDIH